jgi:hypothetical protein
MGKGKKYRTPASCPFAQLYEELREMFNSSTNRNITKGTATCQKTTYAAQPLKPQQASAAPASMP